MSELEFESSWIGAERLRLRQFLLTLVTVVLQLLHVSQQLTTDTFHNTHTSSSSAATAAAAAAWSRDSTHKLPTTDDSVLSLGTFLADRNTNGRAYATLLRPSSVCDVVYYG